VTDFSVIINGGTVLPPPCGKYGAKYCLNSKKAGVNFAELADCRCRLQKHADAGALFETHWKGS